jgi:hypothetical protein
MGIFNRVKEIVKTIRFSGSPRLYGRSTAGAGDGEEITIGSGLSLVGKVLSAVGATWDTLTGKPSTFPPSSHTHAWGSLENGLATRDLLYDNAPYTLQFNCGILQLFAEELQIQGTSSLQIYTPQVTAANATAGQVLKLVDSGGTSEFADVVEHGPYANDAAAATGNGITNAEIGQLYYTADGSVKRRMA